MDDFRPILKRLIEERGTTPTALSLQAGLGRNYLLGIFRREECNAEHSKLVKIAAALGVPLASIVDPDHAGETRLPTETEEAFRQAAITLFDVYKRRKVLSVVTPEEFAEDLLAQARLQAQFLADSKKNDGADSD